MAVAHGPSKASEDEASALYHLAIDIRAATWAYLFATFRDREPLSMITQHVVQGYIQHGNDKLEVVSRQVATAQHQIHISKAGLDPGMIDLRRDLVSNDQDLHRARPTLLSRQGIKLLAVVQKASNAPIDHEVRFGSNQVVRTGQKQLARANMPIGIHGLLMHSFQVGRRFNS